MEEILFPEMFRVSRKGNPIYRRWNMVKGFSFLSELKNQDLA